MTGFRSGLPSVPDWRALGPAAVESALWLVLAATGAWLASRLLEAPTLPDPASMPQIASAPAQYPAVDPFYPADGQSAGTAPPSLAGFTLHGVRSSAGGEMGAIIADAAGHQRAFRVGDAVAEGVSLEGVGTAHAVLVSGGVRHRLALPGTIAAPVPSRPAMGLRVEEHPALRLAGLEPGDVLLSVDGRAPTPELLATIARSGARSGATLGVRRGDRTLTLVVGQVLR